MMTELTRAYTTDHHRLQRLQRELKKRKIEEALKEAQSRQNPENVQGEGEGEGEGEAVVAQEIAAN